MFDIEQGIKIKQNINNCAGMTKRGWYGTNNELFSKGVQTKE